MNLYIGNLDYSIREPHLQELFEGLGEVSSCKVIIDRDSNRSKGFAFIEMPNDDEARQAIDQLNGHQLKTRPISVSEARPREERSDRREFRGR